MKKFFMKKQVQMFLVLTMICATMAMAASAEDVTSATVVSAFTTGFTSLASDAMSMIAAIVPIALGVAATVFLVRKAMSWFKAIAK